VRNVSDKFVEKIKTVFRKWCRLWNNMGKIW